MKNHGFTLIELIVVITILSILGTIAFVSFKGFNLDARNAVRSTDLRNIEGALSLFGAEKGSLPDPDGSISVVMGAGNELFKQGKFGENAKRLIRVNGEAKDPLDKTYYTYSKGKGVNFQITGYLEESLVLNTSTMASDLTNRKLKILGTDVGVLVDASNTPVDEKETGTLDLLSLSSSQDYKAVLPGGEEIEKIDGKITGLNNNSNCYKLFLAGNKVDGKYKINPDGAEIEVYCPMSFFAEGSVEAYVDGNEGRAVDQMGNYEIIYSNFTPKTISGVSGKSLYGARSSGNSKEGHPFSLTVINPAEPSYISLNRYDKYFTNATLCEWTKSEISSQSFHGLVVPFRNKTTNASLFRFSYRVYTTTLGGDGRGLVEYNPRSPAPSYSVSDGTIWQHYCTTYNGNEFIFYINGSEIERKIPTNETKSENEFILGNLSMFRSGKDYGSGIYAVDEAMLFNKALSQEEVQKLYNGFKK